MNFDSILRNKTLNELFMAEFDEVEELIKGYKSFVSKENINDFESEYIKVKTDYEESLKKLETYIEEQDCTIDETKAFKVVEIQSRTKNAFVNLIKKFFSETGFEAKRIRREIEIRFK